MIRIILLRISYDFNKLFFFKWDIHILLKGLTKFMVSAENVEVGNKKKYKESYLYRKNIVIFISLKSCISWRAGIKELFIYSSTRRSCSQSTATATTFFKRLRSLLQRTTGYLRVFARFRYSSFIARVHGKCSANGKRSLCIDPVGHRYPRQSPFMDTAVPTLPATIPLQSTRPGRSRRMTIARVLSIPVFTEPG